MTDQLRRLREFVAHRTHCAVNLGETERRPPGTCDCGLDATLLAIAEEKPAPAPLVQDNESKHMAAEAAWNEATTPAPVTDAEINAAIEDVDHAAYDHALAAASGYYDLRAAVQTRLAAIDKIKALIARRVAEAGAAAEVLVREIESLTAEFVKWGEADPDDIADLGEDVAHDHNNMLNRLQTIHSIADNALAACHKAKDGAS